eukprot:TRINITY_DN1081_c1_g1_i1.p1 TRINITY_DN1081_c1_g1~~TRINITY_DN1081_c1_g1_i1.p1  ORF type:complete len:273 (-),score=60.49 TRINITY_DN1081_c1_g1_i1:435-1253(-)
MGQGLFGSKDDDQGEATDSIYKEQSENSFAGTQESSSRSWWQRRKSSAGNLAVLSDDEDGEHSATSSDEGGVKERPGSILSVKCCAGERRQAGSTLCGYGSRKAAGTWEDAEEIPNFSSRSEGEVENLEDAVDSDIGFQSRHSFREETGSNASDDSEMMTSRSAPIDLSGGNKRDTLSAVGRSGSCYVTAQSLKDAAGWQKSAKSSASERYDGARQAALRLAEAEAEAEDRNPASPDPRSRKAIDEMTINCESSKEERLAAMQLATSPIQRV